MKHLLEFENFIFEKKSNFFLRHEPVSEYDGKVYFIRPTSNIEWLSGDSRDEASKMNEECAFRLFQLIPSGDPKLIKNVTINHDMPIIYYGGNIKSGLDFLKNKGIKRENMYNKPEGMKITGNKVEFQKTFESNGFMPKAVFNIKEAKDLTFPIVAKISNGHSGVGVQKFDTYEDLKKSKDKFDLYMEYVNFNEEYRAFFMKDKLLAINERVPIEKENKTIDTIGYSDKVRFVYVDQDLDKVPFVDEICDIAKQVRDVLPIDVYSVDFVIEDDKIWVLEVNSGTGIGAAKMAMLYMNVYEDYYGEKLPDDYKKELTERYIYTGNSLNYPANKKEISKSKYAIDYKDKTRPILKEWK